MATDPHAARPTTVGTRLAAQFEQGRAESTPPATDIPAVVALQLGAALYRFLARQNEDSEADLFGWEDVGVDIEGGFIELDPELADTVRALIDSGVRIPPLRT